MMVMGLVREGSSRMFKFAIREIKEGLQTYDKSFKERSFYATTA